MLPIPLVEKPTNDKKAAPSIAQPDREPNPGEAPERLFGDKKYQWFQNVKPFFESAATVRTPVTVEENMQRGTDAMKRVIAQRVNEPKAMYRKDLGWIAFYWGKAGGHPPKFKGGEGIAKIIAKRDWEGRSNKELKGQKGVDVALKLVETIAKGRIVKYYGPEKGARLNIAYNDYIAILSLYYEKKEKVWLLNGFKNLKNVASDDFRGGSDPAESTLNEPIRTRLTEGAKATSLHDILDVKQVIVKPIFESASAETLDWRIGIQKARSFSDIEDAFAAAFGPLVIRKFVDGEIGELEKKLQELRKKAAKYLATGGGGEVRGNKTTAFLNDNSPVELQYAVVEADKLITSHSDEMSVNQEFSQTLQPRDRTREGMKLQVDIMANKLNPERLGESTSVSTGAPIIGQDKVVESGNGRTIAIRKAYAAGAKGQEYKQWLIDNAEDFGIPAKEIEGMQKPVLVRIRLTEIDRAEFARRANEDEIAQMAPSELARADAAKLTDDDVALFAPSEDGNIASASNRPFIRRFFERLGQNAATGYMTKDGKFTKQLIDRIQAAIFSKAYQDDYLLELMAEEADPRIKNILSAMTIAAGEFSRAKAIDATLMGIDIPRHVIGAAKIIKKAREDGQAVDEALSQTGLFEEVPEDTKMIALFIDKNIRSARRMGEVLKESAKILRQTLVYEKEPKLMDTGDPLPTAAQIVDMAIAKEKEARESGLFEAAKDFDWKAAIQTATTYGDIEAVFKKLFPIMQIKSAADEALETAEAQRQYDDVVARYKDTPQWKKAPNGEPTNLSERQWVQVRTENFKRWFGDWEAAAKYNIVMEMEAIAVPDNPVSEVEAMEVYKKLKSTTNKQDGREIFFVNKTFGKLAGHKERDLIFRTINKFPEMLSLAEPIYSEIEREPQKHVNIISYNNYLSKTMIDGKENWVRFTVQEVKKPDGNELHSAFVSDVKIEKAEVASNPSGLSTPTIRSTTSLDSKLASWLKKVKADYEVSSKVVDKNGEPLIISGLFVKSDVKINPNPSSYNMHAYELGRAAREKYDRTKFARIGRKGGGYVENLLLGAGNEASRSATPDGTLEIAPTHAGNTRFI